MSSIGFGEDTKISVLVLWELCVKGLDQFPDIRSCSVGAINRVRAVGEANTDRLVNIQHIGVAVPTVRV